MKNCNVFVVCRFGGFACFVLGLRCILACVVTNIGFTEFYMS